MNRFYKETLPKVIKNSEKEIKFIAFLFMIFIVLGFFLMSKESEVAQNIIQSALNKLSNIIDDGGSGFGVFFPILLNNLKVTLIIVLTGWILGIMPILLTFSNGFIIGAVVKLGSVIAGLSVFKIILSLIPHGIIELPAFVLIISLAYKTGKYAFCVLFKKAPAKELAVSVVQMLTIFVLVVVPMLVVAALIESFITPLIFGLF